MKKDIAMMLKFLNKVWLKDFNLDVPYSVKHSMRVEIISEQYAISRYLKHEKKDYKEATLGFMFMFLKGTLFSGQWHVYRGVLGREGNALINILFNVIKEMEKCGMVDKKTAEGIEVGIANGIKEIG
jgi:hypothetical protein